MSNNETDVLELQKRVTKLESDLVRLIGLLEIHSESFKVLTKVVAMWGQFDKRQP